MYDAGQTSLDRLIEVELLYLRDFSDWAISHYDALIRLEKTKKRLAAPDKFSLDRFATINEEIWQLRVDTLGAEGASKLSVEDGKRSPVELY